MSFVENHMRESMKDHVLQEIPAGEFKAFYLKKHGDGMMGSCLILFTPEGVVICGDRAPSRTGRGAITAFRYGLDWFASELYEDYLCSKFLDKEWVPEYAVDYCRQMVQEIRKGRQDDQEKELGSVSDERAGCVEDYQYLRGNRLEAPEDSAIWKKQLKELVEKMRPLTAKVKELREELAGKYEELADNVENWSYGIERFADDLQEIDRYSCDDGVPGYGYPPSEAGWLCAIQQRFREVYHVKEPVGV